MPPGHDISSQTGSGQSPEGRRLAAGVGQLAVLGDFELREVIGRGGMGTVYAAWQRSLQRTVALKVLSQQVSASDTSIQRFRREAHAAAKLHHTHIIPIFAQGEEDGVYYYAMELIDGPNLNTIITAAGGGTSPALAEDGDETVLLHRSPAGDVQPSRSPTPNEDRAKGEPADSSSHPVPAGFTSASHFSTVARHIAAVADALHYAHQQGVVHRDIKPHNLILGGDDRLHISDFGLARVAEQPGVTTTGELIGSPLYMAPEQITEGPGNVDHRADIYSLGATMYEWLTLSPPYPGETRERVISRILSSEPLAVRSLNPAVPVDLETICMKAIERDRHRRYQTASDLRDDLNRFLKSKPIKARRSSVPARLGKFVARHQVASLAVITVATALSLSSALYFTRRKAESQTAAAIQQTQRLIEEKQERDNLLDQVSDLIPLEFKAPLQVVEAARPVLEGLLEASNPSARADGRAAARGPDSAQAGTPAGIARRAIHDLYAAFAPSRWPETSRERECSEALLGSVTLWESNAATERQLVERCLAVRPDHAEARRLHAALCGRMGQFDTMAADARRLIRSNSGIPLDRVWLALSYLLLGNAQGCLDELEHAAAVTPRRGPVYAWIQTVRGLALLLLERSTEALARLNEVLAVSPDHLIALLGRACAYASTADLEAAVGDLSRVIELEPENADAMALRGAHYLDLGDVDAAIGDFRKAVDIGGQTPTLTVQLLSALLLQNKSEAQSPQPDAPKEPSLPDKAEQSSDSRIRDWIYRMARSHAANQRSRYLISARFAARIPGP